MKGVGDALDTILETRQMGKVYETEAGAHRVLTNINLKLERGYFYTIIGRSGSGKSTLLHILGGLDPPTEGQVLFEGRDMFEYTSEQMAIFRRRCMGFVFQQYNLLEEYDVRENICMPLTLDRRRPDKGFLKEVIGMLGLEQVCKKYPSELSGGELQRVAIARSVLAKPKIIFADEPTGNLDRKTGEETLELLTQCAKKFGQTLLIVTHDLEIARNSDIVLQVEDGKILQ